jgi:hypothetical protein
MTRRVLVLLSGNKSAMDPSHEGIRRVIVHRVRKDDARGCPYLTRETLDCFLRTLWSFARQLDADDLLRW